MSAEWVLCTHCGHKHVITHCSECEAPIGQGTPGVFINSVQFNSAAQDQNRAAAEKAGEPDPWNHAGRSAVNLCMPCATAGVNLARLMLRREREWPERIV